MPVDSHRAKRQYQPSDQTTLNSFFSRATSAQSLPLDDETQSSLLNVGMRVRKSVPEGYKTHKTVGSPGFPFPSSAPSSVQAASTAPATLRPSTSTMSSRELVPFCGLHKTGGIGAPVSSAPAAMDHDEDMPELYMSQSTTSNRHSSYSSSSQSATTKKRGYEDETEDDLDCFFQEGYTIGEDSAAMRPKAPVKSSSSRKFNIGQVHIVGHDFEDAPFLVPMDVED